MQHRRIAATAALLGDPSRAAMVLALMDGRSRTAKKLALDAGVTPQTASAHLKKLVAADLLDCDARGRVKEFRLRSADVAQAVEALSEIGAGPVAPAARELRFARCCYDHLAGQLGVRVTERLLEAGNGILAELGVEPSALHAGRRALYRCCTDWTERRPHIAGTVGAALLRHYLEERWLARVQNSRKLVLTERGRAGFARVFGIENA
jgi:DNA-binding transcriptional ArsR family regulator